MKKFKFLCLSFIVLSFCMGCKVNKHVSFKDFGAKPGERTNASVAAARLTHFLKNRKDTTHITITIPKGTYHFYDYQGAEREYYISNHDQDNPKKVGIELKDLKNITLNGQGSEFIFHGRMLPLAIINCQNISLKNLSIDFSLPALRQLKILKADRAGDEVIAELYPKGNYRIDKNKLVFIGEGYEISPFLAMAFQKDKRLTYQRRDVSFEPTSIKEIEPGVLSIKGWDQVKYTSAEERYVLRSYYRPAPGIFLAESKDLVLENVKVHYAEGMGLLAQLCENITLDGFEVSLKGKDDPRYFTTQADATHFSSCKGTIISKNGLYEGMADDAINVHGTYLLISRRVDRHTLQARYMHPQAWGFKWGEAGDSVQFVESKKMELVGEEYTNTIKSIKAVDKPDDFGARLFEIVFEKPLPEQLSGSASIGIENLTWTPEVYFKNNTVRNNRARGALFSTPRKVVCSDNVFDHTHGTAILLCGDCNGWFETGACRDVEISNNTFINALTANYQFTNAVISIYPEIPDLKAQTKFFHSGIVIKNNRFEMFDRPLLYAKSTDGLRFVNNTVVYNKDFEPFHWNKHLFFFEKVNNVLIENNQLGSPSILSKDIRTEQSAREAVVVRNNR